MSSPNTQLSPSHARFVYWFSGLAPIATNVVTPMMVYARVRKQPLTVMRRQEMVMQEVARLQADGPTADLTNRAKEAARREYETALKQNAYWLQRLATARLFGDDPADILTRAARIDAVTPDALRETFRRYFPLDRYTVVTMKPEEK